MKTIPENPQPGERYAVEKRKDVWEVADNDGCLFDTYFSEADARLLVFGAKAIEALRPFADRSEKCRLITDIVAGDGKPCSMQPVMLEDLIQAAAALANLEQPR
jgi:hypothetical protein